MSIPDFLAETLSHLTDQQLDQLLEWVDQEAIYDEIGRWIDINRPALARKLFGHREDE